MRSGGSGAEEAKIVEESKEQKPLKELVDYEQAFSCNTEFFSSCNPNSIEDGLLDYLQTLGVTDSKVNKDKYKVKFSITTKGQDSKDYKTEMCMRIMKVEDEKNCVEFIKLNGNNVNFLEHFNNIKKELDFANDVVK